MAGESVSRIREKEREASELVNAARLDAKRIVQDAREKKPLFVEEKDELLTREEQRIRDVYRNEAQAIVRELDGEEEAGVRRISEACGKSVGGVADFIAREIVKD